MLVQGNTDPIHTIERLNAFTSPCRKYMQANAKEPEVMQATVSAQDKGIMRNRAVKAVTEEMGVRVPVPTIPSTAVHMIALFMF